MPMETVFLIEQTSLQQAPSAVKKRGVFVLALGCVGALCLAGQRFGHREDVSWTSRFTETRRSILKAFRSLSEDDRITGEVDFAFKPVGAELSGMEISSVIGADEKYEEGEFPFCAVTFKAKEGKAADLAATFKHLKKGIFKIKPPPESVDPITITTNDDSVTVKVLISVPNEPEEDRRGGSKILPEDISFKFSMRFGRTFVEMFQDGGDKKVLEAPGGLEGQMSVSLAKALLKPIPGLSYRLTPFTGVKFGGELEYVEGGFDTLDCVPSLNEAAASAAMFLKSLLERAPDLHAALLKLPDFADGVVSARIADSGVLVDLNFKNFHPTPVLKALVEF